MHLFVQLRGKSSGHLWQLLTNLELNISSGTDDGALCARVASTYAR